MFILVLNVLLLIKSHWHLNKPPSVKILSPWNSYNFDNCRMAFSLVRQMSLAACRQLSAVRTVGSSTPSFSFRQYSDDKTSCNNAEGENVVLSIWAFALDDTPVELNKNPYEKEKRKCLLCRTGIDLDYKNARLLQQFVSTFSGRVYDRHITGTSAVLWDCKFLGLCDHQQSKLIETIALSRKAGYMPIFVKDPKYTRDPKLFDPLKPIRPHSFA